MARAEFSSSALHMPTGITTTGITTTTSHQSDSSSPRLLAMMFNRNTNANTNTNTNTIFNNNNNNNNANNINDNDNSHSSFVFDITNSNPTRSSTFPVLPSSTPSSWAPPLPPRANTYHPSTLGPASFPTSTAAPTTTATTTAPPTTATKLLWQCPRYNPKKQASKQQQQEQQRQRQPKGQTRIVFLPHSPTSPLSPLQPLRPPQPPQPPQQPQPHVQPPQPRHQPLPASLVIHQPTPRRPQSCLPRFGNLDKNQDLLLSANANATASTPTSPTSPRPLPAPPVFGAIATKPEQPPELEQGHTADSVLPGSNIGRRYAVRVPSSTHGPRLRASSASPGRISSSETRFMRVESPPTQLRALDYRPPVDKRASVEWGSGGTSDKVQGLERIKERPRLRVLLPLPSNVHGNLRHFLQTNNDSTNSNRKSAEFVIYADDVNVIPSPVDDGPHWSGGDYSGGSGRGGGVAVDCGDKGTVGKGFHTSLLNNSAATKVDTGLSGHKGQVYLPYRPPNVVHRNVNHSSQTIKPPSPPVMPLSVEPALQADIDSRATLDRLRIKRKPAPPLRVHSLPVTPDSEQGIGEISGDSACSPSAAYFCELSPERTTLPVVPPFYSPRPHSSPPETHNERSSSLGSFTWGNKSVTDNWRALSSLDLTCSEELVIYLESLFIIAGGSGGSGGGMGDYRSRQHSKSKVNRCLSITSCYSDSVVSLSSIASSPASGLPSPSEYAPYLNDFLAYFSNSSATDIPEAVEHYSLSSSTAAVCSDHPKPYFFPPPRQKRDGAVVKMGQLCLPASSNEYGIAGIHTLDVLLLAPCRDPRSEQDMPCRTTILKTTRRIAFLRRGVASIGSGNDNYVRSPTQEEKHPGIPRALIPGVSMVGSGKGLLNREKSLRIRRNGGTVLRQRGRDVYLELVILGTVVVGNKFGGQDGGEQQAGFDAFLNRIDGSVWFVAQPTPTITSTTGSSTIARSSTIFDEWLSNFLPRKPSAMERVLAVRWADGLDDVDALRGFNAGGNDGGEFQEDDDVPAMVDPKRRPQQRRRTWGVGLHCPPNAVEMEGVEVYLGRGVAMEEGGWFVPEGW